jgi:hypothetical protein
MHGTRHSQNAGLGRHFPMDAHEGGVEPRKPERPDCVSTPTSLGTASVSVGIGKIQLCHYNLV